MKVYFCERFLMKQGSSLEKMELSGLLGLTGAEENEDMSGLWEMSTYQYI